MTRHTNLAIVAVGLGLIALAMLGAGPMHFETLQLLGLVALVVGVPLLLNQFAATRGSRPTDDDNP